MTAAWRLTKPPHRSVRMYTASLGVSKFCFLGSAAFCGFLLLLIPVFQPPTCPVGLPQPRPQVRPGQTDPSLDAWFLELSETAKETRFADGQDRASAGNGEMAGNDAHKTTGNTKDETVFGLNGNGMPGSRTLEALELKDIFIAVKTTKKYHKTRLELLIQTWISQAKEQVRFEY